MAAKLTINKLHEDLTR